MFNFVIPFAHLSLRKVRTAFGLKNDPPTPSPQCPVISAPFITTLHVQRDNHVRLYWKWVREARRHLRERQREEQRQQEEQERISWIKQMEAQQALMRQRREDLLRRQKEKQQEEQEQRDWETLHRLLATLDPEDEIHQALCRNFNNVVSIARHMGYPALKHYGIVLTAEQHNRLMHALNGNRKTTSIQKREERRNQIAPYGPYTPQGSTRHHYSSRSYDEVRRGAVKIEDMGRRMFQDYHRERGPTVKKPKFRKIQEVTAFETPAEHLGRLEGWRYRVKSERSLPKLRGCQYGR